MCSDQKTIYCLFEWIHQVTLIIFRLEADCVCSYISYDSVSRLRKPQENKSFINLELIDA